jgi:hypothetical protein
MRISAARLGLSAALALAGCRPDPARRVEGEWALELTVVQPGDVPVPPGRRLGGRLVVDQRIPDVYADERRDSVAVTLGRVYLDRRPLYDSTAAAWPYPFQDGLRFDIFEEALARLDSAGRFAAELTPSVTHMGIVLRGTLRDGRITGGWVHDGYPGQASPRGTFTLRRIPRTALTDSGLHRARRAQREWERRRP